MAGHLHGASSQVVLVSATQQRSHGLSKDCQGGPKYPAAGGTDKHPPEVRTSAITMWTQPPTAEPCLGGKEDQAEAGKPGGTLPARTSAPGTASSQAGTQIPCPAAQAGACQSLVAALPTCLSIQLLRTILSSCLASHLSPHQPAPLTPAAGATAGRGQGMVPSTRGLSPSFLSSRQEEARPVQANNLLLGRGAMALLELQTSLLRGPPARPAQSVSLWGQAAAPSTELTVLARPCSALGFGPPSYSEHQRGESNTTKEEARETASPPSSIGNSAAAGALGTRDGYREEWGCSCTG